MSEKYIPPLKRELLTPFTPVDLTNHYPHLKDEFPKTAEHIGQLNYEGQTLFLRYFTSTNFEKSIAFADNILSKAEVKNREGWIHGLAGIAFEYLSSDYLKLILPTARHDILLPHETKELFEEKPLPDPDNPGEFTKTVPDGVVMQKVGSRTLLLGPCEFTLAPKGKHKAKQIHHYTTGFIFDDLYRARPPEVREKVEKEIHKNHPLMPPKVAIAPHYNTYYVIPEKRGRGIIPRSDPFVFHLPLTASEVVTTMDLFLQEYQSRTYPIAS